MRFDKELGFQKGGYRSGFLKLVDDRIRIYFFVILLKGWIRFISVRICHDHGNAAWAVLSLYYDHVNVFVF